MCPCLGRLGEFPKWVLNFLNISNQKKIKKDISKWAFLSFQIFFQYKTTGRLGRDENSLCLIFTPSPRAINLWRGSFIVHHTHGEDKWQVRPFKQWAISSSKELNNFLSALRNFIFFKGQYSPKEYEFAIVLPHLDAFLSFWVQWMVSSLS